MNNTMEEKKEITVSGRAINGDYSKARITYFEDDNGKTRAVKLKYIN